MRILGFFDFLNKGMVIIMLDTLFQKKIRQKGVGKTV
jgi:hypothetical protein